MDQKSESIGMDQITQDDHERMIKRRSPSVYKNGIMNITPKFDT